MYLHVCVYVFRRLCLSVYLHVSLFIYIYIFTNFCLYRSSHTTCIYSTSLCVFMCIHTLSCVYVRIHTSLLPSVFTRLYVCECVHYVSKLVQLSPCWHGCECSCVRDSVLCHVTMTTSDCVSASHDARVAVCTSKVTVVCCYMFLLV